MKAGLNSSDMKPMGAQSSSKGLRSAAPKPRKLSSAGGSSKGKMPASCQGKLSPGASESVVGGGDPGLLSSSSAGVVQTVLKEEKKLRKTEVGEDRFRHSSPESYSPGVEVRLLLERQFHGSGGGG